ncbi:hypothetical protein CRV24_010080 [Beauveria bassiana]|nr:hypothetical protein CRV24_010080 [Beauveria bassiana]
MLRTRRTTKQGLDRSLAWTKCCANWQGGSCFFSVKTFRIFQTQAAFGLSSRPPIISLLEILENFGQLCDSCHSRALFDRFEASVINFDSEFEQLLCNNKISNLQGQYQTVRCHFCFDTTKMAHHAPAVPFNSTLKCCFAIFILLV